MPKRLIVFTFIGTVLGSVLALLFAKDVGHVMSVLSGAVTIFVAVLGAWELIALHDIHVVPSFHSDGSLTFKFKVKNDYKSPIGLMSFAMVTPYSRLQFDVRKQIEAGGVLHIELNEKASINGNRWTNQECRKAQENILYEALGRVSDAPVLFYELTLSGKKFYIAKSAGLTIWQRAARWCHWWSARHGFSHDKRALYKVT